MTNIVMLCHGRLKLLEQSLRTLYANTGPKYFNLTLVADAPDDFRVKRLLEHYALKPNATLVTINKSQHVLARAKNLGVYWSEQTFGRGDFLYLSDSDVAFMSGWLTEVSALLWHEIGLVGGQIHPFHENPEPGVLDGPSWMMRWTTWDLVGELDPRSAAGVCQSEEYPWCDRLRKIGFTIAVTSPHCVIHTGLTNSDGKPAPGYEERKKMIPDGVYAE